MARKKRRPATKREKQPELPLHEAVHRTQWIGSQKKPYSCQDSCYGYDPQKKYCPDDCK